MKTVSQLPVSEKELVAAPDSPSSPPAKASDREFDSSMHTLIRGRSLDAAQTLSETRGPAGE